MEEIIIRQRDAAEPLTGKAFLLDVAAIVLRLALAQIIVNLMIEMSGVGLLNIIFYLYAVWLLVGFMRHTVASYIYTLKQDTLVLERQLGDSPTSVVEIPLKDVVSVRPVYAGERLHTTYAQVTAIDPKAAPSLRMHAAFVASLFSARLARTLAGGHEQDRQGYVVVFGEAGRNRACVFRPDDAFCQALCARLPQAWGFDERMTHGKIATLYGRALERAFPVLYAYVDPLVRGEDVDWAQQELARRKEKRQQRAEEKKAKAQLEKKIEESIKENTKEQPKEKPEDKLEEKSQDQRATGREKGTKQQADIAAQGEAKATRRRRKQE